MNVQQFARIQLSHIRAASMSVKIEDGVTQNEALVATAIELIDEVAMYELDTRKSDLLGEARSRLVEYAKHLEATR